MKPLVYVETSVISYLTARPSRDVVTAARQVWTRDWWDQADQHWTLAASELVVEEAARGDPTAAQRRLVALEPINLIPMTQEMPIFAQRLIAAGAIPATEPEDALHLAVATLSSAYYLVSWNFAHLVGPRSKIQLIESIRQLGKVPTLLATPEELLETLP